MFWMKTYWTILYKLLYDSEELKPLMALYLQDTGQRGEAVSYSRLKEMLRRCVMQKTRDKSFNARNEDRSLQGAAACKGYPRGDS